MSLKTARPVPVPYPRILLKVGGALGSHPVAQGLQNGAGAGSGGGRHQPIGFDSDLRELQDLMDRFTRQPKDFQWQPHPHFGCMIDREWMRLAYLHVDHHLRQFGA